MRREAIVATIAVVVLAAVFGAGLVVLRRRGGDEPDTLPPPLPPTTALATPTAVPTKQEPPQGEPMSFSEEGLAGAVVEAVERPARPGRVRVAVRPTEPGRWVCILVDGPGRCAEFDRGMGLDGFPGLRDAGFARPDARFSRATLSIYRSVAKTAMNYDARAGDRILILVCPRDQWDSLDLRWPPAQETGTR